MEKPVSNRKLTPAFKPYQRLLLHRDPDISGRSVKRVPGEAEDG